MYLINILHSLVFGYTLFFVSKLKDLRSYSTFKNDFNLEICDLDKNSLVINSFEITPTPLERGEFHQISINSELHKKILPGSEVYLTVRYMKMKIFSKVYDLCKLDKKTKCPIETGNKNMTHSFKLPKEIPNGKYNIDLKILDQDKEQVLCSKIDLAFTNNDDFS